MPKQLLYYSLLLLLPLFTRAQNCSCTDCPLAVPPLSEVNDTINISGAVNFNLASPSQGVCAVVLNFSANYIWGITITLYAPNGDSVVLVGPESTFGLWSGGAHWNSIFIPCADPADPDPGFSATWNNNQVWQVLGNYSGTYYPNQGCLEDFDAGSVNGSWRLKITNGSDFYDANLVNFSIVFCDNTGIDCYLCNANAGDLSAVPEITACKGDTSLNLHILPVYTGTPPSLADYSYTYAVSQNGFIIGYETGPDMSNYPPGLYQLCGLSYLHSDIINLPPADGAVDVNQLRDTLNSMAPPFCGKISDDCFNINIRPVPAVSNLVRTICQGDSIWVGNTAYFATGLYRDTLSSSLGCDSVVVLSLSVLPAPVTIIDTNICQGSFYVVGANVYVNSGDYTVVLPASNGCDSTIHLHLTVFPVYDNTITTSICAGETYVISTDTFNASGNYNINLVTIHGCDSTIHLHLTVLPNYTTNLQSTLCNGESYVVGDSMYTATGNYLTHLTASNGCDSTVLLVLTILPKSSASLTDTICQGSQYIVGSNIHTQTGIYIDTLTANNGCDSIVHLSLLVLPNSISDVNATICPGDSVVIGGVTFDQSGIYEIHLASANSCDSMIVLTLVVYPVEDTLIQATICIGENYMVGNTVFSIAGLYQVHLQSVHGCDSLVTLLLSVAAPVMVNLNQSVCQGETFWVGNMAYSQSGFYTDTLLSVVTGCDSIVNLQLQVLPVAFTNLTITRCFGGSYTVGQHTYFQSGVYQDTLTAINGCDSIIHLSLSILQPVLTTLNPTICNGESYPVGPHLYTQSGIYRDTLISYQNCDSIVVLTLSVLPVDTTVLNASICHGQSYTVGANTYQLPGDYVDILTGDNGCDSVVMLHLQVQTIETQLNISICNGSTYQVGNSVYNATGQYTDTLQIGNGCDSIVHLHLLTVNQFLSSQLVDICAGDTLFVGVHLYTQAGIYKDTLTASGGCDSILTTVLNVLTPFVVDSFVSVCNGDSFVLGDSTYQQSGVYDEHIPFSNGFCDSAIIRLHLTVLPVFSQNIQLQICEGDSTLFNNQFLHMAGIYQDTLLSVNGCDSTLILHLIVIPNVHDTISATICFGDVYQVGSNQYSQSGTYRDTFPSSQLCDSIVHLTLTVLQPIHTDLVASICDGTSFQVGDSLYFQNGNYVDTLISVAGCDSVVNLQLSVFQTILTPITASICNGEIYFVGDSAYVAGGYYVDTLTAIGGCDSVIQLNLTVLPVYVTHITNTICEGDFVQVGNNMYTQSGIYNIHLTTTGGCDSTVILDLTVLPSTTTMLQVSLCEGQSYQVGNSVYTQTGMYSDTLFAFNGCDSIVVLDLVVHPVYEFFISDIICAGDQYVIGDSTYTQAGNYTNALMTSSGCDSIIHLSLQVADTLFTSLSATLCAGEVYPLGDSTYSQSGVYIQQLSSVAGCDSIVTLILVVLPVLSVDIVDTICAGESYTVGIHTYQSGGSYLDTLTAVNGCDSLVHLTLTVRAAIVQNLMEAICPGGVYAVGVHMYTQSGIYQDTLMAVNGCDSVVHLQLLVYPQNSVQLNRTICQGDTLYIGNTPHFTPGMYTDSLTSYLGCDSIVHLQLSLALPQSISIVDTICQGQTYAVGDSVYTSTGIYTTLLQTILGCDSMVTLNLTVRPCSMNVTVQYRDIGCHGDQSGLIIFSVSGAQPPYAWQLQSVGLNLSGVFNSQGVADTISGIPAGNYHLHITDFFGNTFEQDIVISEPPLLQLMLSNISNYNGFEISCAGSQDGSAQANVSGGSPPYIIHWENGSPSLLLENAAAGIHIAIATDQQGCADTASIQMDEPNVLNGSMVVTQPQCAGAQQGSLEVAETEGGVSPYLYALDEGPLSALFEFQNIAPGEHYLLIQDANGCEFRDTFEIVEPMGLQVSLGPDTTILQGEYVSAFAQVDPPGSALTFTWSPEWADTACSQCQELSLLPFQSFILTVSVRDSNGCTGMDQQRIFVNTKHPVYIPAAFSPNGDQINDRLMIFVGPGVVKINYFRIFDRWGELLFEDRDFLPDDPSHGWDGTHHGMKLNPQVFVYCAEIQFIDGKTEVYKGDVTLIR